MSKKVSKPAWTPEGTQEKIKIAIRRLQAFEPPDGYFLAFSGGKDSQCVYHLAKQAGVKFDAHYSVTTVDPPELMRFIKAEYPDVIWDHPVGKDGKPTSMWKIIEEHTVPPTRTIRYCCYQLKEVNGRGRFVVTGVRWAESARRRDRHGLVDMYTRSQKLIDSVTENNESAKANPRGRGIMFMDDNDETRQMTEQCYMKRRTTLNPIIDWEDEDVWEYLNNIAKVPHCCLYDEGFTRLGCIGCPLQGKKGMLRDFERWPRYKELYIRAFDRMIKAHPDEVYRADGVTDRPTQGVKKASTSGLDGALDPDESKATGRCSDEWINPETGEIDGEGVYLRLDAVPALSGSIKLSRDQIPNADKPTAEWWYEKWINWNNRPTTNEEGRGRKKKEREKYNTNPHVADYTSAEDVFRAWIGDGELKLSDISAKRCEGRDDKV